MVGIASPGRAAILIAFQRVSELTRSLFALYCVWVMPAAFKAFATCATRLP